MTARLLVTALFFSLFSGISHADSCAAGNFGNLIGTSCTIGNGLYSFVKDAFGVNAGNDTLTFTPLTGMGLTGFELSGLPGTHSSQQGSDDELAYFTDSFSMVPLGGTILSSSAILNGVSQHNSGSALQESYALLGPGAGIDDYSSTNGIYTHVRGSGGPAPSFDGSFKIYNTSFSGDGTVSYTGFKSADFIFNVPEGSELVMLSIAVLTLFGAMKKTRRAGFLQLSCIPRTPIYRASFFIAALPTELVV